MRPECAIVLLLGLLLGQSTRGVDDPPSLALLEFLGSLVEIDEELLSPMDLDESIPTPAAEEVFGWGDWVDSAESPASGDAQSVREEP